MMQRVYFANIDVDLGPETQVHKDHPKAGGALVDCIFPGKNKAEAIEYLKAVLQQDGYALREIKIFGSFQDFGWENEELRMEYYAYAWQAHIDGIISYGVFFAYDTRQDEDVP